MTIYAVGDIQGCVRSFEGLLEAIGFDPAADRLWLAGDLVNRGPDSLGVLRRAMSLQHCAVAVLGNHDLHLLAIAAGVRPPWPDDTFDAILAAPDRDALIDWLRRRPLLHHDAATRTVLVHAGLPPGWSLAQARKRAAEVSEALAGPAWRNVLQSLYDNEPSLWSPTLDARDRRRYTINSLTRMRYLDEAGRLDFAHHGPPGSQPPRTQALVRVVGPGRSPHRLRALGLAGAVFRPRVHLYRHGLRLGPLAYRAAGGSAWRTGVGSLSRRNVRRLKGILKRPPRPRWGGGTRSRRVRSPRSGSRRASAGAA